MSGVTHFLAEQAHQGYRPCAAQWFGCFASAMVSPQVRPLALQRTRPPVPGWPGLVAVILGLTIPLEAGARLQTQVVVPISSAMVLPDTPLRPDALAPRLAVQAARGEFEPASILIRAGLGSDAIVAVEISDLVEPNSKRQIESEEVDVRVVKPWFQGRSAWVEISKEKPDDFSQVIVPELLLKDDELVRIDRAAFRNLVRVDKAGKSTYTWVNPPGIAREEQVLLSMQDFPVRDSRVLRPFRVSDSVTKQIWVTFHVPDDAEPGSYVGRMTVRGDGHVPKEIALELKVHSFVLAESPITYSIFYRAQLDSARASVGSEYRNIEQVRNELRDLRDHGVRSPTMYQPVSDRILLRRVFQLWAEAGLARGDLFFAGMQTTENSLGNLQTAATGNLNRMFSLVSAEAVRAGFSKVYVYGADEAQGPRLLRQRNLWKQVQRLGGGVFVAGYSGAHALVGDVLDVQVNYGKPDASEAAKWRGSGKQIFSYANPQSGPENPYLFRLNYGLMLWAHDYDGAMPYAYQHCFGSCWNDSDHAIYRDHNMTYPTADGIIPTLAWEGFREARDDVRYVATLEEAIRSSADSRASRDANAYLVQLRADLRRRSARSLKYNADVRLDLDSVRRAVVSHIEMIHGGASNGRRVS